MTVVHPHGPRPGDPRRPQRREERSPTASASPVGESTERPLTAASGTPVAAAAPSPPADATAAWNTPNATARPSTLGTTPASNTPGATATSHTPNATAVPGTPVAAGASSIPATQAAAPGASGEMPGTRRHAPSTLARPARLRASRRVRLIGQARVPEQEGAAR
ncbi:hypothetical protein [Streptomyces griseorubiginosus]|uniref:hypothetical protein n=1 Tax=Streptomyces griseorubiginosus TaxID=67304 RepID=UPI0033D88009